MQAQLEKIRPFIYKFTLNEIPFTLKDINAEIEDWRSWPNLNNTRYKLIHSKNFGPIVQNLHDFFCSTEFQNQIIDTIGQEELFYKSYWKHNPDKFKNRLCPIFEGNMDTPGFFMSPHLDNRALVTVGMCHFIEGDDPLQSTTFYTTEDGADPLRIPTGFGVGWVCANLHNTWHSGLNHSTQNRFSVKFGSQIQI